MERNNYLKLVYKYSNCGFGPQEYLLKTLYFVGLFCSKDNIYCIKLFLFLTLNLIVFGPFYPLTVSCFQPSKSDLMTGLV